MEDRPAVQKGWLVPQNDQLIPSPWFSNNLAIKISIAGLGWWGKVMIERLSRSNKLEIVNLIDPCPDQEALKLAKTNNLEIYKDFDAALNSKTFDAII